MSFCIIIKTIFSHWLWCASFLSKFSYACFLYRQQCLKSHHTKWPLTRYVILRDANASRMLEPFSPQPTQRKPLLSDSSMHHGTCVAHVPWYMSGSLTRGDGENVPGIPGACATRNFAYLARGPCPPDLCNYLHNDYHRRGAYSGA